MKRCGEGANPVDTKRGRGTPSKMNTCKTCSGPVSVHSRTGNCRVCALAASNADPRVREKIAEANRRKAKDPVFRAKLKARIARIGVECRTDEEFMAVLRENGRKNIAGAWTPEARAKWYAGRQEAGRRISATRLAWCPPDRIAEYRHLTRVKRIRAAEARRMILDSPTPFQRMLDKISAGAGISIVRPFRKADHPFTLGGVSSI
jgi:hypothetical protein